MVRRQAIPGDLVLDQAARSCGDARGLKRLLAGTAVASLFGFAGHAQAQAVPKPNVITPDGRTQTTVSVKNGATWITTSTIKGGDAYNSFNQFQVGAGATANLVTPDQASALINLVRGGPIQINGILNSYKDGKIGGNVYFFDPYGLVVGSSGVLNFGSLTIATPTLATLDQLIAADGAINPSITTQILAGQLPGSSTGVVQIQGLVNAPGGFTVHAASFILDGPAPTALSADAQGAVFTTTVNTDGQATGGRIVTNGAEVEIVAEGDAKFSPAPSPPPARPARPAGASTCRPAAT